MSDIQSSVLGRQTNSRVILASQVRNSKCEDDLLCSICLNLLWDPVQCGTCKVHVCRNCLNEWRKKNQVSCPISGCESFTEEKAHPYFYKHLTGVDLICPNLLCEAIIRYEQYSRHVERECDYSNQICCYTDCGEQFPKKDQATHEEICMYSPAPCSYCAESLTRKTLGDHQEFLCQSRPIHCQNERCEEIFPFSSMQLHVSSCGFFKDICSFCSLEYMRSSANLHENHCDERNLRCTGCEKSFKQKNFADHIEACELITKSCEVCAQSFPRIDFKTIHSETQCLRDLAQRLQSENVQLKSANQKLQESQTILEKRMETVFQTFNEVTQLQASQEAVRFTIKAKLQTIWDIFNMDGFIEHQLKQHKYELNTPKDALRHFEFLQSTGRLYKGWQAFHCLKCHSLVGKISVKINSILQEINDSNIALGENKFHNFASI